jgi:hypothetical protein
MRLYPTHLGLSTPFAVFFLKKGRFFPTSKINPLKTRGWGLKIFSTFFENIGVFMDKAANLGANAWLVAPIHYFSFPVFINLGKTL